MNIRIISDEIESLRVYRQFVDVMRSIAQVKQLRVRRLLVERDEYWRAIAYAAFETFEAFDRFTKRPSSPPSSQNQWFDPAGGWAAGSAALVASILRDPEGETSSDALRRCLQGSPAAQPGGVLLLVVGSHRGLCGDFDRRLIAKLRECAEREKRISVVCAGSRTRNAIDRSRIQGVDLVREFSGTGGIDRLSGLDLFSSEVHQQVKSFGEALLEAFCRGRMELPGSGGSVSPVNGVRIIHNRTRNDATTHSVDTADTQILPPLPPPIEPRPRDPLGRQLLCEPSVPLNTAVLLSAYVGSCLQRAFLESSRTEHEIRYRETTEASHSLEEMIEGKTMEMRKARRERITRQLVELISAADAYEQG
jgi:F-type H+-transporting ATPase subunit gamma